MPLAQLSYNGAQLDRLRSLDLTPSAARLRAFLDLAIAEARRAGRDFVAPSIAAMAAAIRRSRRQTIRAKAELIAAGLYTATKRFRIVAAGVAKRMSDRLTAGKPALVYSTRAGAHASSQRPTRPPRWIAYLAGRRLTALRDRTAQPSMGDTAGTAITEENQKDGRRPLFGFHRTAADSLADLAQRRQARRAEERAMKEPGK